MKLLLENWRKYLTEEQVIYSGILMLDPDAALIEYIQSIKLPDDAVRLSSEDLHVTLLGFKALKSYKKALKAIRVAGNIPEGPSISLLPDVEKRVDEASNRTSWVLWVENQQEMKDYVNLVMGMVGGPDDPEPNRRFHISIANLTGNPHDSVP
jgi:hypothetical protein